MTYGRLECLIHFLLLCSVVVPLSFIFVACKFIQSAFSHRKTGKQHRAMMEKIHIQIAKQFKKKPRPVILITGSAHFSKTALVMQAIKTVLPGEKSKVILIDFPIYSLNATRFSKYCDVFEYIHSDPETQTKSYIEEIVALGLKHKITGFVPVSKVYGSLPDGTACEKLSSILGSTFDMPFHLSAVMCSLLDDKLAFCKLCTKLGVKSPRVELVDSEEKALKLNLSLQHQNDDNLKPIKMIIKSLGYDSLHRLDLFTLPTTQKNLQNYLNRLRNSGSGISPENPWIARTKLVGRELSSACVIRNGNIQLLSICESSASQIRFAEVDQSEVRNWTYEFVDRCNFRSAEVLEIAREHFKNADHNFDSANCDKDKMLPLDNCIIAFDFMETEEGVYTMECNPRVHSQLSTFRPNELGRTLLGAAIVGVDLTHSLALDRESLASFTPNITRGVMYFGDEVFKLLFRFKKYQKPGTSSSLSIFCHDDPDLDLSDPLPFFIKQHLQITQALFRNLVGGKPWEKLNFNLGKLVAQGE